MAPQSHTARARSSVSLVKWSTEVSCVHPMLGKPMRATIGGGKAVIGAVKVAAAGAVLDVPLGHKDDSWLFPHFDNDYGLNRRCPSTRRDPGRDGDC